MKENSGKLTVRPVRRVASDPLCPRHAEPATKHDVIVQAQRQCRTSGATEASELSNDSQSLERRHPLQPPRQDQIPEDRPQGRHRPGRERAVVPGRRTAPPERRPPVRRLVPASLLALEQQLDHPDDGAAVGRVEALVRRAPDPVMEERPGRPVEPAAAPGQPAAQPCGRVPRLARLMALAIRMDGLVRSGEVADYADIARLGHVSRARATQIMNLLLLAPEIQEALLFLPRTERGRDPIREHHIRPIAVILDWSRQREMWRRLS